MQFEELPYFSKRIAKLGLKIQLEALKEELSENPERGDVIPGAAGARKVRMAAIERGKSGGARAIYYFQVHPETIIFIEVYTKNEKESLSSAEKKTLAALIKHLKGSAV